jgi:type IV pilus assembly protein PilM
MKFFSFTSEVFGLDIGDFSLKAVFLKKTQRGNKLVHCGERLAPAGYFINGEVKKPVETAKFMRKFIKETHISTPYVVAVLPETKTFIKLIKVPKGEANITENVKKEIELCMPFKMEDVYFDWQKIASDDGKNRILAGLAPKDIVESYLKVLKMAGLKPLALEIESVAIARALLSAKDCPLDPKIILDLGATRSGLIIVDEGMIQLTISLSISGQSFTNDIVTALKITSEEAEKIKKSYGQDDKNPKFEKIVTAFLQKLADTLQTHINFYQESSGRKVGEIILSGGGASFYNLAPFLAEKLKTKVAKGNPWTNVLDKKIPLSEEASLAYNTAIGLALRGLEEKI